MNVKSFIIVVSLFSLWSCNKSIQKTIELNFEKDLIPEGIAIDSKTKKVYLNSLKNNKIVASNLDGSKVTTFLESNQYNYQSGFGMTIKGDTLYALGNSLTKQNNQSILLLLNTKTGVLIDSYTMQESARTYWNDLTISHDNIIYITESESNKIYKIQRPSKSFEIFLDVEEVPHCNGITISKNNKYLYFGSRKGLRIVDVKTKKILNEENSFVGIDGLKFYKNSLIGNINVWPDNDKNGLYRFYLDEKGTSILNHEKILAYQDNFKIPTTFDIFNDNLYIIINSQMDNFDDDTNQIVDKDKLENYILMKLPLIVK